MHEASNVIDGVSGEVGGGVGGIVMTNIVNEEAEEDGLEVCGGDVQKVDTSQDGKGARDSGKPIQMPLMVVLGVIR